MSGNTTSLYGSNSSSNTASTNFTTLYSSGNTVAPIGVGYGNANVAGFLAAGSDTGGNVIANITATGNIQTSGFFIGNFLGNISGNLIVPGSNTQILYNNNGNAGASNNFRFSSSNNLMTLSGNANISGNVTGGNITTPGQISAAGNVRTTGIISATGNVTGYYFIGNGSQLTGVVTNVYGNSNVTSLLANLGSNVISTTGNVTGGNLRTAGQVSATGNVTGGNVLTAGQVSATGNVTGGNVLTGGVVSATGNVAGNFFIGNGSQLTGIASTYGNAQVAAFLNAFGSNSISTTGNVTASYFAGNGSQLSNITAGNITGQVANALVAGTVYTAAQPNITSVGILTAASVSGNITGGNIATAGQVSAAGNITAANFIGNITGNVGGGSISVAGNITGGNLLTGGLISAAGNITGNVFVGNGAGLTSLVGATVTGQVANALVAGTVYTAAQPNITSVGILTSASVSGNITTGGQISATGNITAPNFIGNIAGNIAGGFISVSGNITGGNLLTGGLISATGNITGGNLSGATVTATTLNTVTASATGNVTGGNILTGGLISATGNITSGNLINNGTITSTGNITAPNFFGNVSGNIFGNIDAAGSNTQVQFNDTGDILGASAGFTFDKTANLMTVTGNVAGGNLTTGGQVSATANITGGNILTAGEVSAVGNITGGNLVGNFVISSLSVPGNVTAGNINSGGLLSVVGNIYGGNILTTGNTSGNITGANYVSANYFVGNGSSLIGVAANTAVTVTANAQPNITSVGSLTSLLVLQSGISTSGNVIATGGTGGYISATGNISGSYFIGNGSQLTGIAGSGYGNANVAANLAAFANNPISTTGNVTAGYVIGNGSLLTNLTGGNVTGSVAQANQANFANTANAVAGANVTGTVANATYALNSNAATFAGTVTTAAQPNITSVGTLTSITSSGNISTTGNVAGNYFIGNGSQLTGLPTTYGNSEVAAFLSAFGSNNISTTGNVTTGGLTANSATFGANTIVASNVTVTLGSTSSYYQIVTGNVSQTIELPYVTNLTPGLNYIVSNQSTANVQVGAHGFPGGFVATLTPAETVLFTCKDLTGGGGTGSWLKSGLMPGYFNGGSNIWYGPSWGDAGLNMKGGYISGTGNITTSATGNIQGGNILTAGIVSATGNVTGSYIIGNGSQLTGLPAGYSNADVTTLLASFGSNSISTTGNVTAGYVAGNGSLLTNLTGGNVTGQVANALVAGTVYTAAQPNITSVGILTSASVTGNITTGNLLTGGIVSATGNVTGGNVLTGGILSATGNVTGGNVLTGGILSATGNVTGNYFIGNGSQLTGIVATSSYDNANVATFLAAFGSNTISTTGTVTAGNITGGNILSVGVVSATGNVTGNYIIGNGAQLTGLPPGPYVPGGSDQMIQYNNVGLFGGSAAMTFVPATGNVTLSNVIIGTGSGIVASGNNAQLINTSNAFVGGSLVNAGMLAGTIQIGNGYFGNLNINNIQARPYAKFQVWDSANVTEVGGNSLRYQAGYLGAQLSMSNVANTGTLLRGAATVLGIGGGPSANVWSTTNQGMFAVLALNQFLAVGQPNTVAAIGNVTLTGAAAAGGQHFIYAGSNVGNAGGVLAQISAAGNVTTGIGVQVNYAGTPATTPTNTIGYYMPGITNNFGATNSNGFRQATNYYFLKNDDNVAQNQLGSLRAYHTFQSGGNTTGTWDIDKTNGQVQAISATGNITIGSYTNFVTTASNSVSNLSQTDTVTLIIEQGATPYTVTMPTGNAAIRYASGNSTVPATANSTTTISIQAYRSAANATAYITTISPAAT